MSITYDGGNALLTSDVIIIGSAFINTIKKESSKLPSNTFVVRNGRYNYEIPSRVFVDAPEKIRKSLEEDIHIALSNTGTFGSFTVGSWPGIDYLEEGNCYADDCIIFKNGIAFFGSVYVSEWVCNIIRSRG